MLRPAICCLPIHCLFWGWFIFSSSVIAENDENTALSALAAGAQIITVDQRKPPDHGIVTFDLATNNITQLFKAGDFSRVHQLTISSDNTFIIFAYTPPPSGGSGFFDRSALYRLDLEGTKSKGEAIKLLGGNNTEEFYLEPALSPDSRWLFYVKVVKDTKALIPTYHVTLERYDFANKTIKKIVSDGIWPRVSADGKQLTFIGVQPRTQQRGLFASDLAGEQIKTLVPVGTYLDIDTPLFSLDGQWIYFSVAENPYAASWIEKLLGINAVHAHADHNIPSAWWRISVNGGEPEQLTDKQGIIIHGDFDPKISSLAFSTTNGLYLMSIDGKNVESISTAPYYGTLNWLIPE